jgi:predicted phage gp36 major capsid-like protein
MIQAISPTVLRRIQCVSRELRVISQAKLHFTDSSWNKKQIDRIERKFKEPSQKVESDDELQQMWRQMESRVTRRRPRTLGETKGKTGRENVRKTDEEMRLEAGFYEYNTKSGDK